MGRGGSSLDVLALWSVCECVRFCASEYSGPMALILFEYVIMTSMFLYGVVQPGSVVPPTVVSGSVCVSFSESLQQRESKLQIESHANSLCVLKIFP